MPAIARFDRIRPAAHLRCRTPADVAAALATARSRGLPVAIRSGGHCFAGRSSTTGVVIDVGPMDDVTLEGEIATIGAGAQLADVYAALGPSGRAIPGGCGPTVGIAGLTLGGGLGVLGRRHGLTCDALLGAEVVLADGTLVRCDEHEHPDLLWALRGAGGGQLGVVMSLTFATVEAPVCDVFAASWPADRAADLVDAWQDWAPDARDELAASLLVNAPADPGRPVCVTLLGSCANADAPLEELFAGTSDPAAIARERLPWAAAKTFLAEHGPGDEDGDPYSKSEFFRRSLPREAVDALVAHVVEDRVAGVSRELDLSPWGGAYNRVPAEATAFAHRGERFLLKHAVGLQPGVERDDALAWLRRSWALVRPFGAGRVYPNFPDPELEDPGRAYHGENLERLRAVKRVYDPGDVFRFPGSVSPAA